MLFTPPLSQTVTPPTPDPSSVMYFMDGPLWRFYLFMFNLLLYITYERVALLPFMVFSLSPLVPLVSVMFIRLFFMALFLTCGLIKTFGYGYGKKYE